MQRFIETLVIESLDQVPGDKVGSETALVRVGCKLHNLVTQQLVDVTYVMRMEDLVIVRHDIHRIQDMPC